MLSRWATRSTTRRLFLASACCLASTRLSSQAYGRRDYDECHRWLAQAVYLACVATLPLMLLVGVASFRLTHFGVNPEVAAPAASYLRILNWEHCRCCYTVEPGATYRASVKSVSSPSPMCSANLLNWAGNWVLIYGKLGFPALGVRGSAISTCVARVGMAMALMAFAWRYERKRGHPLFRHWAAPQLARLRELVRLGAPAGGQILLEVGAWNLATFSAGYLDPVALATHAIALNYASLSYMVPLGVSAAAAVSVGHAIGAGDGPRARRAGWLALGLGTGFMLLTALLFLFAPRSLIAVYTRDQQVMAVGPALLYLAAAFQVFDGIQTVCTGALRGLGETRVPMVANFIGYWILGLPLGLTLCFHFHWGIYGTWIGLTVALIVIALSLLIRWRRDSARVSLPV